MRQGWNNIVHTSERSSHLHSTIQGWQKYNAYIRKIFTPTYHETGLTKVWYIHQKDLRTYITWDRADKSIVPTSERFSHLHNMRQGCQKYTHQKDLHTYIAWDRADKRIVHTSERSSHLHNMRQGWQKYTHQKGLHTYIAWDRADKSIGHTSERSSHLHSMRQGWQKYSAYIRKIFTPT